MASSLLSYVLRFFFSDWRSWLAAAALSAAVVAVLLSFVLEIGYYQDPARGPRLCVVNKKVWSADADVSVGNTAVVKSPDGDVILRIMALPGDTVSISDASVGVSDSRHAVASFLVMRATPYATLRHLSEEHKAVEGSPVSGDVYRLHVLTRSERWRDVTYTHPLRSEPDERVFPWSSAPAWNFYHWGPFVLPRRGQSIVLSPDLFPVYAPLIRLKEAADPVPGESYSFKHSYYFALSDDRDVINDCRLFGPLTESEIIGRARVISN